MRTLDKVMLIILIVVSCSITQILSKNYSDQKYENLRIQMINQRTSDAVARVEAEGLAELERLRCKEQWLRSGK